MAHSAFAATSSAVAVAMKCRGCSLGNWLKDHWRMEVIAFTAATAGHEGKEALKEENAGSAIAELAGANGRCWR